MDQPEFRNYNYYLWTSEALGLLVLSTIQGLAPARAQTLLSPSLIVEGGKSMDLYAGYNNSYGLSFGALGTISGTASFYVESAEVICAPLPGPCVPIGFTNGWRPNSGTAFVTGFATTDDYTRAFLSALSGIAPRIATTGTLIESDTCGNPCQIALGGTTSGLAPPTIIFNSFTVAEGQPRAIDGCSEEMTGQDSMATTCADSGAAALGVSLIGTYLDTEVLYVGTDADRSVTNELQGEVNRSKLVLIPGTRMGPSQNGEVQLEASARTGFNNSFGVALAAQGQIEGVAEIENAPWNGKNWANAGTGYLQAAINFSELSSGFVSAVSGKAPLVLTASTTQPFFCSVCEPGEFNAQGDTSFTPSFNLAGISITGATELGTIGASVYATNIGTEQLSVAGRKSRDLETQLRSSDYNELMSDF